MLTTIRVVYIQNLDISFKGIITLIISAEFPFKKKNIEN